MNKEVNVLGTTYTIIFGTCEEFKELKDWAYNEIKETIDGDDISISAMAKDDFYFEGLIFFLLLYF